MDAHFFLKLRIDVYYDTFMTKVYIGKENAIKPTSCRLLDIFGPRPYYAALGSWPRYSCSDHTYCISGNLKQIAFCDLG